MNIVLAGAPFERRKSLRDRLTDHGYKVTIFGDVSEVVQQFIGIKPAIVVLSGCEGIGVFRAIRAMAGGERSYLIAVGGMAGVDGLRDGEVDDEVRDGGDDEEIFRRLMRAGRVVQRRRENEARVRILSHLVEDCPFPVMQVDAAGMILYANAAGLSVLGAWGCGLGGRAPGSLGLLVQQVSMAGRRGEGEVEAGGRMLHVVLTPMSDPALISVCGQDITDRRHVERELTDLKSRAVERYLHDQLTGLPNRALLNDRLAVSVSHARRSATRVAVVILDLDEFNHVNEVLGHQQGDQALILVARCVQDALRTTDSVGRWSGDQLVVVLEGIEDREAVGAVCGRLADSLRQKFEESHFAAPLTLSMGGAIFPDDGDSEHLVLQRADQALSEAKAAGRNCWRLYHGDGGADAPLNSVHILHRLNVALRQRGIGVHFQPIVDAAEGGVVGFEALARWNDPELGWVSPDRFIALAETRGLIVELGWQVISQALDQKAGWDAAGYSVAVSINLSKRQILVPTFAGELVKLVEERRLVPGDVVLEVTERQSLLNDPACRQGLESLAAAGFRLSLDDFGSGHSSFDMVAELPFHELKIAMGLGRKAAAPKGRRIVQAILEMCQTLGLKSVVEGVEDSALAGALREIGADKLQGYFYSRPLPPEAVIPFLRTSTVGVPKSPPI